MKNAIVVGDFNELPPAVLALESALRWHRLDPRTVADAVGGTGAAAALGIGQDHLVEAVLQAGHQARDRLAAAPARSEGSCYFPEPTGSLA